MPPKNPGAPNKYREGLPFYAQFHEPAKPKYPTLVKFNQQIQIYCLSSIYYNPDQSKILGS